ncbi:Lnb N-terminal periplasmic domain-containing protein [Sinomicrobium sp. M5D2P17]
MRTISRHHKSIAECYTPTAILRKVLIGLPFLFLLCNPLFTYSQQDTITVSLLTCSTGRAAYSIFGHSAIRIQNQSKGEDFVYDFGVFNPDEPFFFTKFITGKLKYSLEKRTYPEFIYSYLDQQRGVVEQEINLNPSEKIYISNFLTENLKPANRYYYYDFFKNNCSTKIRDLVFRIKPEIKQNNEITEVTWRERLHNALHDKPWYRLGIDVVLGENTDKKITIWDQTFLPIYLAQNFQSTKTENNKKLITNTQQLLPKSFKITKPAFSPLAITIILVVCLATFVVLIPKSLKTVTQISNVILGSLGLILTCLCLFSHHTGFQYNWNLLWLNPIYLLVTLKTGNNYLSFIAIGISMLCLALWSVIPQNLNEVFIPIILFSILLNVIYLSKK